MSASPVPPLRHLPLAGSRPAASARGAVLPDVGVVAGRRVRALPPARRALGPHVRHRRGLVRRGLAGYRSRPAPTGRAILADAVAPACARRLRPSAVPWRGCERAEPRTMFGADAARRGTRVRRPRQPPVRAGSRARSLSVHAVVSSTAMIDRGLADLVVAVHLAYIAFIPLGGFLAWKWPRIVPVHLAAVAAALISVTVHYDCPLTGLEKTLRRHGGEIAVSLRLRRPLPDGAHLSARRRRLTSSSWSPPASSSHTRTS